MWRNKAATKPSCSWVSQMTGDTILNALIDSSQHCFKAGACVQNGVSAVKRAVRDMTAMMPAYHVQVNASRAHRPFSSSEIHVSLFILKASCL